jgi:hypothetical protein
LSDFDFETSFLVLTASREISFLALEKKVRLTKTTSKFCYPALASVFGDSGYFEPAPRPYTFDTGNYRRKDTGLERRKSMANCDPCTCRFHPDFFPAKSPKLNPAENAQNMLKHTVIPDLLKREGIEWTGDWKNKVSIVEKAIKLLTWHHLSRLF